jgi:hypothetical protein
MSGLVAAVFSITDLMTGHKRPVETEEQQLDGEEEDDGGGSPLYCNWDLRGMQHLLPLQDYIIQQAKLSSEYIYIIADKKSSCGQLILFYWQYFL